MTRIHWLLCAGSPVVFVLAGCRGDGSFGDLVAPSTTDTNVKTGAVFSLPDSECKALDVDPPSSQGHVAFMLEGRAFRMPAGGTPLDVSRALDKLSPGTDTFINISPDGTKMVINTSRFGCGQDLCLAMVDATLCRAEPMVGGGDYIRAEKFAAVGPNGDYVIFPLEGGPHALDLWITRRAGDGWTTPEVITSKSKAQFNMQPALSIDGSSVLFDCGGDPGSGPGTQICEMNADGSDLHVAVSGDSHSYAGTQGAPALHHAAYALDGSIVFEGTWWNDAEQIWRQPADGSEPEMVSHDKRDDVYTFTDDNSPCVLPSDDVVSLWLGRTGTGANGRNSGHEIKTMNPSGIDPHMLLANINVTDVGTGCGR